MDAHAVAEIQTHRLQDRKRIARGSGSTVQDINQLLEQFNEMRTMIRQMSTGKGKWAQLARQYGGDAGMPGMPAMPRPGGGGGKKKTGKAARKEKRKQKAKSGRR